MCIIVLRCFVLVRFPNKMFEWATWWRWPTASQRDDNDGKEKKKRRRTKEKHRSKEAQKGLGQKGKSKDKKDKKQLAPVQNLYQASPNERRKKCCCVLIFSLLSWVLTEPKNKRATTNPSAWCVLNWPFCSDLLSSLDFAWAFPGANVAPHGFPYGITSMDTSQREFQHSSQHSSHIVPYIWR